MIARLYPKLGHVWPWFRKTSKRVMYQFMAKHYVKKDWSFMNYGYASLDPHSESIVLEENDEPDRYCIQLYHHVANAVDLKNLNVVEIGSGRGGGADYVKQYLNPKTLLGVDYSSNAVALCAQHHCIDGLAFVTGDAERLPFDNASFDAVINVESSHCYRSMDDFVSEVIRVLRPGGHFLFADFRPRERLGALNDQLDQSGLRMLRQIDITRNVIAALDADHVRKLAQIKRGAPWWVLGLLEQFAGLRGTRIYEQFRARELVYQSFVLQKPLCDAKATL